MKAMPSKVVLLMSAAGLGLSWSGVAFASRYNNTAAGSSLTFGMAPRGEQACSAKSPDGWASCPPAQGELLRQIVAKTATQTLPLAAIAPASDHKVTLRVLDAFAATSARQTGTARTTPNTQNGESEPGGEIPLPEAPVAARATDGPVLDRLADAFTMLVVGGRAEFAGDAATEPGPIPQPASTPAPESDSVAAGDSTSTGQSHLETPEVPVASTPAFAGKPDAMFTGDRSIGGSRAATAEDPELAGLASVDQVFTSLVEVLGSQAGKTPSGTDPKHGHAAAPEPETVFPASLAHAAPEPGQLVSASSIDANDGGGFSHWRLIEADEIVVAPSHSDKILMSLAALRMDKSPDETRLGAQTKRTVVVRHVDKVLETLAMFQSRKPRQTLACTAAPGVEPSVRNPTERKASWDLPESADDSSMDCIGPKSDTVLDLLPPAADRLDTMTQQAEANRSTRPDLPIANRIERHAIGGDLVALSAEKLDEVRGGFVTDGGLRISFGIERAVYLNGNLVATTSLNIADLAKISGGQAQVTSSGTTGNIALLQNGAGNVFAAGSISSTAAGTVIQNTLDNQKINTITRIDAVVNSAGIMRSINLQSSMRSAIVDSLRR